MVKTAQLKLPNNYWLRHGQLEDLRKVMAGVCVCWGGGGGGGARIL